jgi:hypothetical protein
MTYELDTEDFDSEEDVEKARKLISGSRMGEVLIS